MLNISAVTCDIVGLQRDRGIENSVKIKGSSVTLILNCENLEGCWKGVVQNIQEKGVIFREYRHICIWCTYFGFRKKDITNSRLSTLTDDGMRQLDHSIRPLYGIDDLEYLLYFIDCYFIVLFNTRQNNIRLDGLWDEKENDKKYIYISMMMINKWINNMFQSNFNLIPISFPEKSVKNSKERTHHRTQQTSTSIRGWTRTSRARPTPRGSTSWRSRQSSRPRTENAIRQ